MLLIWIILKPSKYYITIKQIVHKLQQYKINFNIYVSRQNLLAIFRELQNLLIIFREKSFLVMSLVKNICKDMIEQYKKDQMNNVKFDGLFSPILITMIPLKVNYYF